MTRRMQVNGRVVDTEAVTLAELLQAQGYDLGAAMACAINSGFVPRTKWAGHELAEGDCIDVIVPVTGG